MSVGVHAVLLALLLLLPDTAPRPPEEPTRVVHKITPLYIPTEFTQKAPNKGKVQKELTAEAIAPRPEIRKPAPAPAARPNPPKAVAVLPPVPAPPQPKPVIIEPPKIAVEAPQTPAQIAQTAPPPAPITTAPPVNPEPKLSFQDVTPPSVPKGPATTRSLIVPNTSVQEAVRSLARSGLQQGQAVGDIGSDDSGSGFGLNLPPSAGRPRSQLELKSDPMGVDFRPYLLQVLAAVRRNWFAVYPEAARLGQRGQVMLQFAISKQGGVAKVVFSTESGAKALDQAAVAAISASNPLPPLPTEFKGDRIVLQMTFQYNMAR